MGKSSIRKGEDESLQSCRADKCCLKSQRGVPVCIQTQAFPISCVTARAVVSATGNRLRSLWKGSVSMLWMFINHYIWRSGIILMDYTGGRRGDWLGWRRVANNKPTCGFDCFHLSDPTDYSHKSAPKNICVYISVKSIQSFGAIQCFNVMSNQSTGMSYLWLITLCMSFGPGFQKLQHI